MTGNEPEQRASFVDMRAVPKETLVDANYVVVFDLGITVEIDELVRRNELVFGRCLEGAMCSLRHPKSVCLIFSSGKVVIVGARNEKHAVLAAWSYVRELRRAGLERATVRSYRVCNITSTYRYNGAFDLLKYHEDHPDSTRFKIDSFPGITIWFPDMFIVVMAFASARINVTGAVHSDETLAVLDGVYDELKKYVVRDPAEIRALYARINEKRSELRKNSKKEKERAPP